MRILQLFMTIFFFSSFFSSYLKAEVFYVSSQQEFDRAQNNSIENDSIIWRSGTYSNIFMEIEKNRLFVVAEDLGSVIFTGFSRVDVKGDYITLEGFQFLDGNIGTRDVVNIRGSHIVFTQINIRAYTCYKYLRVREESQFVEITYCNFENRLNLDDQNILSILVDEDQPGYHKIQYCSFKNFDGTGNDLGIEPIRIGLSTQADRNSRSLVEYCYFTQCNGDGEIISSKASQNVYRYNTFEDNPLSELVLRHGSEAVVYGNFFLNGKGGVRVREGQNHYIYNNYFYELDDRAIFLQNKSSDPLGNINIAFNTIIDCSEVILGGNGNHKPTQVTFANNLFANPDDNLFEEATRTETWINNIAFGDLGISLPASGITATNPLLEENSEGFFGLAENSPAINAAQVGYAAIPQFEGMEAVDTDILLDLMKQSRPVVVEEKDLGSNEYPHAVLIRPMATEANTGPSYNTSSTTSSQNISSRVTDLIRVQPNPVRDQLLMEINIKNGTNLRIDIFNSAGRIVQTITEQSLLPNQTVLSKNVENWSAGLYTIRAFSRNAEKGFESIQVVKFVKSR
ncbi:MAG: chondroitinase-B domain-containing protein [Bacteroidota bacterium]